MRYILRLHLAAEYVIRPHSSSGRGNMPQPPSMPKV